MENLIIEGNLNTPNTNFNLKNGVLSIFGRSIPENPIKYYQPLEDWIINFLKTSPSKITFQIHLDYLNTLSTECIFILMKTIEKYYQSSNSDIKIIWNFDEHDEDMDNLGRDLSTLIEIPLECIEIIQKD